MATKNIKKILLNKDGDNYVADIEDIENRISQNSSNLETAKQELSNKCNEALSEAKAYTDQEKAKYLPLIGGTLTGDFALNGCVIRLANDEQELQIVSGTNRESSFGARLGLRAKNNGSGPGSFHLLAHTDTTEKYLAGYPDGRLTWGDKNIVRSVNGINADENGNVQLDNVGAIPGEIKWFAFNTVPDGYIICNGAKVSRTTYADLFAAIGTSFGSGDGSTTFDLPDLIDRFAQGSRTVGTYKGPGLPNINGLIGTSVPGKGNIKMVGDGAFTPDTDFEAYNILFENNSFEEEKEAFYTRYKFDASRSNSIYGNSTTVQPPTLTLLPCIKY